MLSKNSPHALDYIQKIRYTLRGNCDSCFGLCCIALYYSASDGFPADKEAGIPCIDLQSDFRCGVHNDLLKLGLKGCLAFDCLGAGQKVSQLSFAGKNWSDFPETKEQMFEIFLIMRQLHEILWYLTEAVALKSSGTIHDRLGTILDETVRITELAPEHLLKLDVAEYRAKIKPWLLKTSRSVRNNARKSHKGGPIIQNKFKPGCDLSASNLRGTSLIGTNLRGACLIAADLRDTDLTGSDFLGADFRDTDIRGANLSQSIFLTQVQLCLAKGNESTRIPSHFERPVHWENH